MLSFRWGLRWPDVIISVTGAAAGTIPDLAPDQREVFQLRLTQMARPPKLHAAAGCTLITRVSYALAVLPLSLWR
jgi:hypothetical protein